MKKIFRYMAILLLVGFTASSCEDNDNWRIITDLQEGVYVAGDATVYSATASAAALGSVYFDPADQEVAGVSGISTWLKANTPFYIVKVDAEGNEVKLGAGAEVTVDGTEGKTYAAAVDGTLSVSKEGFYSVVYNATDNQITVMEYVMTIIGDATAGKWDAGTPMGDPVYNEATSTVAYTMTDEALNNKEMKFRVGSGWQFGIPYGGGVATVAAGYGPETAMDLGEASTECFSKPGLPNFKIATAGLYDITLTYELRSKKFMAKAVYKGKNPDAPAVTLPEKMYMIGDFCGWDWNNAPEMIPVHSHDGVFWGIYYLQANEGFKFNHVKSWDDGDNFGAESEDMREYGEVPVGGSNIKVKNTGYYQVLVTCTLSADGSAVEKKIELIEPAVYLIGDAIGTWDAGKPENRFTLEEDVFVSPATVEAGKLRMYVQLPARIDGWFWWQSEFMIFDGNITYRGKGNDQEEVTVSAGQVVKLNFKDNTGTIE